MDPNTMYKVESRGEQHSTLSYENGQKVLEVPNALIPFWTKRGESLYYKDGEFRMDIQTNNMILRFKYYRSQNSGKF